LIKGIEWCVDNGADIISMSLGGGQLVDTPCDERPEAMAVNVARDAGIVVVSASGNNANTNGILSPACASGSIAVGATDDFDVRAAFSNGGSLLDVMAPGVNIVSASLNNGFLNLTGTSMSTPHVSGTIALMLENNPTLTPNEVRTILQNTSVDLGDPGFDILYGFGRINALAAVDSTPLPPPLPPPPPEPPSDIEQRLTALENKDIEHDNRLDGLDQIINKLLQDLKDIQTAWSNAFG